MYRYIGLQLFCQFEAAVITSTHTHKLKTNRKHKIKHRQMIKVYSLYNLKYVLSSIWTKNQPMSICSALCESFLLNIIAEMFVENMFHVTSNCTDAVLMLEPTVLNRTMLLSALVDRKLGLLHFIFYTNEMHLASCCMGIMSRLATRNSTKKKRKYGLACVFELIGKHPHDS